MSTIFGTGCLEFVAKLAGGLTSESLMDTIKLTYDPSGDGSATDASVDLEDTANVYANIYVTISGASGKDLEYIYLQNTEGTPTVALQGTDSGLATLSGNDANVQVHFRWF